MVWLPIAVGTLIAFAIGIMGLLSESWRSREPEEALSVVELKRLCTELKLQRRILLFWFSFSGFWIAFVADDVDWSYCGRWTGLYVFLGLIGIYTIWGLVYRWIQRRKTTPEDPSQHPSKT